MADLKNLEGMIDSTPIMKDFADVEKSSLPEYQIDSKIFQLFVPFFVKFLSYRFELFLYLLILIHYALLE